jgi:rhamnogalacturonan endolyase
MKVKKYNNLLQMTIRIIMVIAIVLVTSFTGGTRAYAASIGVTDDGTNIIVDTGAGLVYKIKKTTGDMTSAKLNGTELNSSNKPSQIDSGLGTATVTYSTFASGSQVLITCKTDTITHYYASKSGDNTIYMATYASAEPSNNELRYIFRGNMDVLTNVPEYSDLRGNTGAIESTDVYGFSDGHTASKYYGNDQAKDLTIRGVTGDNVGVFMAYGNRETSIGGPFQRDIQFQTAYPDNMDVEITNYMNSNHAQTETSFRLGLFGSYALCFTDGSTPSVPDYSWMSNLGLKDYVSDSDRGTVVLNGLSGMDTSYDYIIGFANSTAQYWAEASSTGAATCSGMKPGTYTMTVYKGELGIYTESVTVTAGSTTTVSTCKVADPSSTSTIWRIGDWDGTPLEFANGENIQYRHPSDSSNDNWGTSFTIGNADTKFPAAQFRLANSPETVTFNLTANEASVTHTLKIGITTAYNNGRPSVIINGHTLTIPSAATEPSQRTLTTGTYRGNNATFSWDIPSSYFVAGSNTITIKPASGSTDSSTYLSASYAFDCLELDGTPDVTTHTVTFNNPDGTTIGTATVDHGGSATAPAVPTAYYKYGYNYTWDTSFTNVISDLTVTAILTQNTTTYTVSVTGGTVSGATANGGAAAVSGNYQVKDKVAVTATPGSGQTFSYWKDANNQVVSYAPTFKFNVASDVTLTAVYDDSSAQLPSIIMRNVVNDSTNGKISFITERAFPKSGYTLVSHGIILTSNEVIGVSPSNFQLSAVNGTTVLKNTATSTGLEGTYVTNKTATTGVTWYGRGYLTYSYDGSNYTIYSDILSSSL